MNRTWGEFTALSCFLIVFVMTVSTGCKQRQVTEDMSPIPAKSAPPVVIAGQPEGQIPEDNAGNPPTVTVGRYKITRVGMFKDDTAYDSRRSVYTIVDTKKDREFLGISGIGIAELGDHENNTNGKVKIHDER